MQTEMQQTTQPSVRTASPKEEKVSISLLLTPELLQNLKLEAMMCNCSVSGLVEQWIDQNVSPDEVVITADEMTTNHRERFGKDQELKTITIGISKKHHSLLRLEAFRRNTTIRAIITEWLQENIREWIIKEVAAGTISPLTATA